MNIFSEAIVEWYKEYKRDLPWRESSDPYRIWISEIILQQTRVAQGYDYFLRFIKRFPDVKALADADEDEVMKYWQGLGYYSRARNLHAAAKSMNGVFRKHTPEVLALKGVGSIRRQLSVLCLRYALCGGRRKCVSGTFPVISALILRLTRRKERNCLLLWRMKCWIRNSRLFIIRVLWTSERYSVLHSHPIVCFARWRIVVRHFQQEG